MNIFSRPVLVLLLCMGASLANAAPPPASADITRAIEETEAGITRALDARDRAALEPLIADPFTWIHASDGRVDTREAWLANAAKGMALTGQRVERAEHGSTLQMHGAPRPGTVIRIAQVRLFDAAAKRESWMRQTHTFVLAANGRWQLAMGQGVLMYEGPPLDLTLHARYAGTYEISPGRVLLLTFEDGLYATFPSGAKTQIFLASPTEEATRVPGAGRLKFTLDDAGNPIAAALVRGDQEVWRAKRRAS